MKIYFNFRLEELILERSKITNRITKNEFILTRRDAVTQLKRENTERKISIRSPSKSKFNHRSPPIKRIINRKKSLTVCKHLKRLKLRGTISNQDVGGERFAICCRSRMEVVAGHN